jgi:hypothetical protein
MMNELNLQFFRSLLDHLLQLHWIESNLRFHLPSFFHSIPTTPLTTFSPFAYPTMHAGTVTSLLLAALALPVSALPRKAHSSVGKAIYVINNDVKNAVVAVRIGCDGQLSGGSSTATGGAGASGLDASTNETAAPDSLFSQSSLTVAGTASRPNPAATTNVLC